jgi:apolipoprotein N-acyltransferase
MKTKNIWIKDLLFQLCLTVTASILFTLSFPNPLFKDGLPFIAWFAYIPILLLIQKNSILQCVGWGAIYGCLTYLLFNYWLITFHSVAGAVVYTIYLVYLAAVFLLLKLAEIFYPKKVYLVQWIIWLAYEYMRTKGFVGYSYGITGYSQWRITPLIQIASITGIWGVSALVTFPSFWLAAALKGYAGNSINEITSSITAFFKKEKISVIVWAAALALSFIYGITSIKDFSGSPPVQIALIQHNADPWEAVNAPTTWQTLETYKKDLEILKRLSDEVLAGEPKPHLVVWPETAFVPRIYWHATYRNDQETWLIVKDLLDYLSLKDIPFLIGNDDARRDPAKNPSENENYRVDYNAALLFENGQITEIYRKMHLVPFTEHFPYKKQFPSIYRALQRSETHFWEKGEEGTVFNIKSFNFSAPICFEDTFGYISRNFVLRGADVLVNITNDAWAKSLSSQKQHLSTAVFRAVENCRPMVRSTVSGQTCAIDPYGRITAEAIPFTETWLNVTVPIIKKYTIFTLYGDYLGITFLAAAVILLLSPAVWYTIKKQKRGNKNNE